MDYWSALVDQVESYAHCRERKAGITSSELIIEASPRVVSTHSEAGLPDVITQAYLKLRAGSPVITDVGS